MDRQDALIKLTNTQINNLTQDININLRNIEKLRTELEKLKTDYAEMIVTSRKNQSTQNKLMFILSSRNFWQAYKRISYMKQYARPTEKNKEIKSKKRQLHFNNTMQSLLKKERKKNN